MNINMKKVILVLLVIMVLSFTIAASIMGVQGIKGTLFHKAKETMQWGMNISEQTSLQDSYSSGQTGQQGISATGETSQGNINEDRTFKDSFKDISIDTVSSDIKIIPVDSNDIKVHFYGYTNRPAPDFITDQNGSELFIQVKHRLNISVGMNFTNENLKLDIYVPKNYSGNIKTNTVSGKTSIEGFTLGRLDCSSVSGSINGDNLNTKETDVGTTSGSVDLKRFTGALDGHSVSGKVNVEYSEFNNDARIKTVSGSSNLRMSGNSAFTVDFSSVSGKFNSEIPVTTQGSADRRNFKGTVGNGGAKITFNSTSGSLNISK